MKIRDRYASAINSSNLAQHDGSDADILGAYGLADAELTRRGQPLAVAIERFISGDKGKIFELRKIIEREAKRHMLPRRLPHKRVREIASAALMWLRQGRCASCGGHGFKIIPGTKTLGDKRCGECCGTGKWSLEASFECKLEAETARYLVSWIEPQLEIASCEAMKKLAPRLDL